ncbi:MAG: ATP-binding protein [Verrucomicrobiae bacterium]|nr:ATP-binding protein [Verrucomicrobiae bacterium]
MFKKLTLRAKLLIVGISVAFLPAFFSFVLIYVKAGKLHRVAERGSRQLSIVAMDQTARDVCNMFEMVHDSLKNTADNKDADPREQEIMAVLRKIIINIRLGKTGYVAVMQCSGPRQGTYIISKDGVRDGENVWDVRDAFGKHFIQEICVGARTSNSGEIVEFRYHWKNPDDPAPRLKISRCIYFKPWDWVIGVGAYEDDFLNTSNLIRDIGNRGLVIVFCIGMITLPLSGAVWFVISGRLASRIDQTMAWLRENADELSEKNRLLEEKEKKLAAEILERERIQQIVEKSLAELEETHAILREHQSQLIQSEKMASLGQLAAGVAHEINNPVGFVMSNFSTLTGYVNTMKELLALHGALADAIRTGDDNRRQSLLNQICQLEAKEDLSYILKDIDSLLKESLDGANRVREIVQDLKTFVRLDEAEIKEAGINEELETTLNLIWNELKYKCEIRKKYGPLPPLRCHPGQLNQVFMNLLVNAAQAIPEKGVITIETSATNENISVKILDTGGGIPPENIPMLFTPFFTTKPVGKGTGLGLSISYGIVKKHGGSIQVESIQGKGTTFTVLLPRCGVREGGFSDPPPPLAKGLFLEKNAVTRK